MVSWQFQTRGSPFTLEATVAYRTATEDFVGLIAERHVSAGDVDGDGNEDLLVSFRSGGSQVLRYGPLSTHWTSAGSSSDWSDANNWSRGVPHGRMAAVIGDG